MGTNLLELGIGRDLGALKGLYHLLSAGTAGHPFLGTNLLELGIGRDLGALKGLYHLLNDFTARNPS